MAQPERRARATEALRSAGDWLLLLPRGGALCIAIVWMGAIAWLSSQPGDAEPGPWWRSVVWNGGHAPIFGLLGLWFALALPRHAGWPRLDRRGVLVVLGCVAAYAAFDEWHQSTTPLRDFSVLDVLTDLVGTSCVLWIAGYLADHRADDRGLARRMIASVALCTLAAVCATFVGASFRELSWL